MNNKSLIVICGPTASGKSQLAIDIAKEVGGEIVNADTMSFYRNMNIGTAKVMPDQMQGIAHHMIDVLDITEDANVAWYQHQARKVIDDIIARGKRPILVGGTGLYIKAVVDEMNFPETNPEIRDRLNAEAEALGKAAMYERLKELDPAAAIAIDSQNLRRVIRALEVIEITGKPYTANLPQAYLRKAVQGGLQRALREGERKRKRERELTQFGDHLRPAPPSTRGCGATRRSRGWPSCALLSPRKAL